MASTQGSKETTMGAVSDFYKLNASTARLKQPRLLGFIILAAFLVCSLAINLLLSRRVASFRRLVTAMKSERRLGEGDKVPPLAARDPEGKSVLFDYKGIDRPTVVFVISPSCGWCTKNVMNMRALVEKASDRYRFVGFSLSSDKLLSYVKENKLEFPIYTDLPYIPTRDYKLGGTPETFVVSPNGEVMKIWSGAFADATQKDIEAYFGVSLPGIMDPEKTVNQ
jgi:peroxiredoxin